MSRELPIHLPDNPDEIGGDTLLLTAYQYDLEQPGSDLRAVLSRARPFAEALQDDRGTDTVTSVEKAAASPVA